MFLLHNKRRLLSILCFNCLCLAMCLCLTSYVGWWRLRLGGLAAWPDHNFVEERSPVQRTAVLRGFRFGCGEWTFTCGLYECM